MRWVTIGASAFITLVVGVFFVRENVTSEWRAHQHHYREFLLRSAATDAEREVAHDFPIKLRQQYLPELGRVDRCMSCHAGIEDPRAQGLQLPLRTHPGDYLKVHDVERFGCTICHDGQGRATRSEDALGRDPSVHFERPMLQQPFLQARCYRCHARKLAETPVYNRGKDLFDTNGCLGCHRVQGTGGPHGPTLDGLSDAAVQSKRPMHEHQQKLLHATQGNVNLAYILEAVMYPVAQPPDSAMFDFGFSPDEALALAVYLKSFEKSQVVGRDYIPRERLSFPADRNERGALLFARFCSACHGRDGSGGRRNTNAFKPEIPNLATLNERLMLFERKDAQVFFDAVDAAGGQQPSPSALDIPRAETVVAAYEAVVKLVRGGNRSGKRDPAGPAPLDMPAWGEILDTDDIVVILSHLVSLGEFDDDADQQEGANVSVWRTP